MRIQKIMIFDPVLVAVAATSLNLKLDNLSTST